MDLKLNVSKKGLSTTEEVINEEYTLHYGHIFRGKSAYEYAVEGGFVGSEEEYEAYVGSIGNLSEEAKEATAEAKEAAVDAQDAREQALVATDIAISASRTANQAAENAEDATQTALDAAERANKAAENAESSIITIDKELSPTSDNAIANSAVVQGLAGLAEGVSEAIGNVSEQLGAEIETKANKEGYYPDMSVGMADNLVGRGDVQDAQINFRPSAGDANITDGAARIERIKGNSVVWNQLVNTDSTSVELVAKRTYFTDIDGEHSVRIISATTTIEAQSGRDKVVDLTQMFGVGNEPTTVEAYYQRKPMNIEDEYAYNAGTLVDMKVDSLISTSDNAYDYVKGYARVMGGQTYDCSYGSAFVEKVYFSTDKDNIVAEENVMTSENGKYVFPSDGYVVPYTTDGDKREYCVCLQHTYTKPHPAYQQEVKDLGWIWEIKDKDGNKLFENGMRDIPKTTHSTRGVCDEILYNPTKKKWEAIKRIKRVEGLQWSLTTYPNTFAIRINGDKVPNDSISYNQRRDGIRSNKYGISYPLNYNMMDDKTMLHYDKAQVGYSIFIKDTAYATAAEFNEANKDLVIYYELEKPIVEDIEGSENWNLDYLAWDFGTEEAIASVPSAPFRADINYEPNAVDDLRWAVSEIRKLRAELAQVSTTNLTE